MRLSIITLSACLFACLFSFSQKLTIISSTDKKPLPNTKLIFNNKENTVKYTDSLGVFYLDPSIKTDSILVDAFQFDNKKILYPSKDQIVILNPEYNILSELIINKNNNKINKNKTLKKKSKFIIIPYPGTQIVKLFEIDKNANDKIKSVNFTIGKKKGNIFLVKLLVYDNINNKPGNLIHEGEVVQVNYSKRGKISISPKTEIRLPPQGYFVGIEYLGFINNANSKNKKIDPSFKFVYNVENEFCYIKSPIKALWTSFNDSYSSNAFEKKYLYGFNPFLSLELEK